jgi:hypothetical protein
MVNKREVGRVFSRISRRLGVLVPVLLAAALALEILPFGVVESEPAVSGKCSGRALAIEPLQVCDDGVAFLGGLFDLPVLIPSAPSLVPTRGVLRQLADAGSLMPDGFRPAIDRPPRLPA